MTKSSNYSHLKACEKSAKNLKLGKKAKTNLALGNKLIKVQALMILLRSELLPNLGLFKYWFFKIRKIVLIWTEPNMSSAHNFSILFLFFVQWRTIEDGFLWFIACNTKLDVPWRFYQVKNQYWISFEAPIFLRWISDLNFVYHVWFWKYDWFYL